MGEVTGSGPSHHIERYNPETQKTEVTEIPMPSVEQLPAKKIVVTDPAKQADIREAVGKNLADQLASGADVNPVDLAVTVLQGFISSKK